MSILRLYSTTVERLAYALEVPLIKVSSGNMSGFYFCHFC